MTIHLEKTNLTEPPTQPLFYQEGIILPWLTLEVLLYSLIISLALALRLWNLGSYPLSNEEANHALIAMQVYHGDIPALTEYSPLLVSGTLLNFFLFGDSDSTARLATVMLGMLLVILPLTLRPQLGSKASLIAAALFAISPTALFLSRTLNSQIAVAVGSLMLLSGFLNWAAHRQTHWLVFCAAAFAILLTAGPTGLSVMLIFILLMVIGMGVFFKWSTEEALAWVSSLTPTSPYGEIPDHETVSPPRPKEKQSTVSVGQQLGLYILAILAVLATAGSLNFSGLGVISSFPQSWLSYFGLESQLYAGYNAVLLFLLYEPVIFLFGLIGLAYAMSRNDLFSLAVGGWFVGLLLLDVVMGGRPNGSVILPLVPLTLLAAAALAYLWDSLEAEGEWRNEGLLLFVGVVISIFGYIGLTGWLTRFCADTDQLCVNAWVQPLAAFALFLTVALFFYFLNGLGTALRGIALTLLAVGLLITLNSLSRLNYGPLQALAYQPLAGVRPATQFVEMLETIRRQSAERNLDTNLMDILLVDFSEPALEWQFRNFPHVTQVHGLTELPTQIAVIMTTHPDEELPIPGDTYVGQSFQPQVAWSPINLSNKDLVSWLIYRTAKEQPQGNEVVLWLRME